MEVTVLKISEPHTVEMRSNSKLEAIDISLTQLDIQIEGVKGSQSSPFDEPLFHSRNSARLHQNKRFKYDLSETEESDINKQSVLNLSPVKEYDFDKDEKDEGRRKQSLELKKGVRETIIEEEEEKNTDSRLLEDKFVEIFVYLDARRKGILNKSNSESENLHP